MKMRNIILISVLAAAAIFAVVMIVNAQTKTADDQAMISPSASVEAEPAFTTKPTPTPAISASPSLLADKSTDEPSGESAASEDKDTITDESSSSGSGSDNETSPTAMPAPQPTPTAENPAPTSAPTPCPSEDAQQTIDDTHDWIDDNHPTPAPPDPDLPGIGNW